MQEKYTKKAFDVLQRAKEAAAKLGNEYIGTEHILLGLTLVQQSVAAKALEGQNVTYHQVMERICEMQGKKQKFYLPLDMTPRAKRVVERSKQEAVRLGANYVGTEHILLALLREPDTLAITLLEDLGVDIQTLYEDIMLLLGESEAQPAGVQGMHERPKEEISETETLDKFSRDMTALAKQGKFDPIVGREQEIERIIRILSRRTKNNPCLMGDPGVGKTAIVEGLAQKISDGNVPDTLRHKRILSLDLSAMVAGSKYRGEFEERMKKALEDVKAAGNIILFIDEIHRINRLIEEILYPAMEDFVLDIVIGKGADAKSIRLDLPHFTLIGATTRIGLLTAPLRDRFGVVNRLELYTPQELMRIVIRSANVLNIPIDEDGALELARRSRGTPRIANRLLKRVRDFAQVKYDGVITGQVAKDSLDILEVDKNGLDLTDKTLLMCMIDKFGGGPVGLDTLSVSIGEEAETIEDVVEPYLIQQGFIKRTPRGRVVTNKTYEYFGLEVLGGENND